MMIGLAVYLNTTKLTVAGTDDLCVLNAIVNAVGELGTSTARVDKRRSADLWLSMVTGSPIALLILSANFNLESPIHVESHAYSYALKRS